MFIHKINFIILALIVFVFGQTPQVIFKTEWGNAATQIGLREAPDARYGAQAFRVLADTVSILDGQNSQLKFFKSARFLQALPVSPMARDFISTAPGSYMILSDRYIQKTSLSKQDQVRSIEQGRIILRIQELPGTVPTLSFSDGLSQDLNGNAVIQDNPVRLLKLNRSRARLQINTAELQVDFELSFPEDNLASLQLAGVDAQKHLFIHLEFFLSQVPLQVERQIRVYNVQGEHLFTYGLALNNYALIFRDLYVDSEGNLYQMLQLPEGLRILKWNWPEEQPDVPIEWEAPQYNWEPLEESDHPEPGTGQLLKIWDLPDVTPETALAIGDSYDKLNWTCTADNLTNGIITDAYGNHVQTPEWLYVGNVQRVPYKWGGFNTIDGFLAGIAAGKYAGDKATDSVSPEAVGVDCSGFVSRCWTLPTHYSTRMMDDYIAQPYDSWEQTLPGDACHKPGHVRLIVAHRADGSIDMVEAAGFNWRVSYTNYTYSQITTYTPRYYINMQGTPGNIPQPTWQHLTFNEQFRLRWSVSNSNSLSGYSLKQSADANFWDEEDFIPADSLSYSANLVDSQVVYFKLTSISSLNQSESLPSDTYGVYRNDLRAKILIVDGFDRISASSGSWNHVYHDFAAVHGLALEALNFPFETVANEALLDAEIQLSNYEAVIWLCGDESTADETFSSAEQTLVSDYLTQGGQLFVSGSEIGWDLDYKGSTADKAFYNNYLKADFVEDDAGSYAAIGVAGSPFDSLNLRYDDGSQNVYPEDYPDAIKAFGGSAVALNYGNGKVAATYYEGVFGSGTDTGRVFYLAFPFETIYRENERIALLSKITKFFKISEFEDKPEPPLPVITKLELYGNYPNPFNGQTQIRFYLPAPGIVKLSVFNMQGKILLQEKFEMSQWGKLEIPVSAKNWASGIYAYRITSETVYGKHSASGKIVLLK